MAKHKENGIGIGTGSNTVRRWDINSRSGNGAVLTLVYQANKDGQQINAYEIDPNPSVSVRVRKLIEGGYLRSEFGPTADTADRPKNQQRQRRNLFITEKGKKELVRRARVVEKNGTVDGLTKDPEEGRPDLRPIFFEIEKEVRGGV